MTALLEAKNVGKTFGGGLFDKVRTVALRDFSLAIESEPPSILAGLILRSELSIALSSSAKAAAATTALRPSSGLRPACAERPVTTTL